MLLFYEKPGVANFAGIINIAAMFIKNSKDFEKLKKLECIY